MSWFSKFIESQDYHVRREDRFFLRNRKITAHEHHVITRGILGQLDSIQETLLFLGCIKSASFLTQAIIELEEALVFSGQETQETLSEQLKIQSERQANGNAKKESTSTQKSSRGKVFSIYEKRSP